MGSKEFPETSVPAKVDTLSAGIVRACFNGSLTRKMTEEASAELTGVGVPEDQIMTYQVPGAFELPRATKKIVENCPDLDGVIPLGVVIRGETPHFDYICEAVTQGLKEVSLNAEVPVVFGVLTCDTRKQALARVDPDGEKNKGRESARALLSMIHLEQTLS